jgi:hypothetical protein
MSASLHFSKAYLNAVHPHESQAIVKTISTFMLEAFFVCAVTGITAKGHATSQDAGPGSGGRVVCGTIHCTHAAPLSHSSQSVLVCH